MHFGRNLLINHDQKQEHSLLPSQKKEGHHSFLTCLLPAHTADLLLSCIDDEKQCETGLLLIKHFKTQMWHFVHLPFYFFLLFLKGCLWGIVVAQSLWLPQTALISKTSLIALRQWPPERFFHGAEGHVLGALLVCADRLLACHIPGPIHRSGVGDPALRHLKKITYLALYWHFFN